VQLAHATEAHISRYANVVEDLLWSTGPASYGYQLGSRDVMAALVVESWPVPGTLFGHDAATLALADGELVGIEIGFVNPGFVARVAALGQFIPTLVNSGAIDIADIEGVLERSAQCAWLNPGIPSDAYYLHAIAVSPQHQGRGVGALLMHDALNRARTAGAAALHLDVLSDNPAVDFYRAFGLECVVESRAPIPFSGGVPIEYRMVMQLAESRSESTAHDGDRS
jgi:GNAT superfamily N-acetyltransferase